MDSAENHSMTIPPGCNIPKDIVTTDPALPNGLVMSHATELNRLKKEIEMLKVRHRAELDESTRLRIQHEMENSQLKAEISTLKKLMDKKVKAAQIKTVRMMKAKYDKLMICPEKDWAVTSLENFERKLEILQNRLNEAEKEIKWKTRKLKTQEKWLVNSNDERLKLRKVIENLGVDNKGFLVLMSQLDSELERQKPSEFSKEGTEQEEIKKLEEDRRPESEPPMDMSQDTALLAEKKKQLKEKILMKEFDLNMWAHKFRRTSIEGTAKFKDTLATSCCRLDCKKTHNRYKVCSEQRNAIKKREEEYERRPPPAEEKVKYCDNCFQKKILEVVDVDELIEYIFSYRVY